MESTHERRTVLDPKADNRAPGDRNRANNGCNLAILLDGRNYCDIDAGRSAMPSPAVDQWHSVGYGQRSGRIVSIWTHWPPICAAGKRRRTGRSRLAAYRELSLQFGFRVALQRRAWLRQTVDGYL